MKVSHKNQKKQKNSSTPLRQRLELPVKNITKTIALQHLDPNILLYTVRKSHKNIKKMKITTLPCFARDYNCLSKIHLFNGCIASRPQYNVKTISESILGIIPTFYSKI